MIIRDYTTTDLAIGDHLTVSYGTYYHHGIYCGNGVVVHLSGEYKSIIRISFSEFANDRSVYIENTQCDYSGTQVAERALSRVGENGYGVFRSNCEHFVVWCRTNKMSSQQVKNVSAPVGKFATRVAAKQMSKSGSKLVGKTLAKGGGVLFVADIAQLTIEQCGGNLGLSQEESRGAGLVAGLATYAAAGAVFGGPVGAAGGAAVWFVGEVVGEMIGSIFDG